MAGPGGTEVGRARLVILPDLTKFGVSLKKYVERVERQLVIQVPTQLDTKGLAADMAKIKGRLERDAVQIKTKVASIEGNVRADVAKATKTAPPVRIKTEVDRATLSTLTTITGQLQTSAAAAGAAIATWGPALFAAGAAALTVAPAVATVLPVASAASLAIGTLALGLNGLGDAITAASDPKKFAAAMKGLSKEAQATVRTIVSLKPAFNGLRTSVQDALLKGIGPSIQQVAKGLLPVLRTEMVAMASAFNAGAKSFASFVSGGPGLALIKANLAGAREALAPMGAALKPITTALLQLGIAASPAMKLVSQGVASAAISFAAFIDKASKSGTLQKTISDAVTGIGKLLGGIGAVLKPLSEALVKAGPGVIDGIVAALKGVGSVLDVLVKQGPALGGVFTAIWNAVKPVIPAFQQLVTAAGPLISRVFTALTQAGPQIGSVLTSIGTFLQPLINGFKAFIAVVGPQLGPTITALTGFLSGLMPTLREFAAAFSAKLGAGIAQIGTIIANDVLPAIQRILPVLQPVAQFLLNVLGTAVLGVLNGVINVVKGVLKVFSGLLDFITGVFTGNWSLAWSGIQKVFAGVWDAIKGIVEVAWNIGVVKLFRTGLVAIKTLFTSLPGTLKSLAGKAMTALKSGATSGFQSVLAFYISIPRLIVKGLGDLGTLLLQAGKDVVRGLVNGLKAQAGTVVAAAQELAKHIPEPIRKFLHINSPSKLMISLMRFVGDGLVQGLLGTSDQVASAAQDLAQKIADAISSLTDQRSSLAEKIAADTAKVTQAKTDYATAVKTAGTSGSAAIKSAGLRLQQAQAKLTRDQGAGKKKAGVIVADKAAVARAQLAYKQAISKQGTAAQKTIATARKKLVDAVTRLNADKGDLRELDASFLGLAKGSAQARLQSLIDSSTAQLTALADQRAAVAEKVKAAQDQLAQAIQVRDDYAKSLRDAVIAFGDVTKAQSQAAGAVSAKSIVTTLRKQLAAVVAFRQNVELLRTGGLSDAALQQILAAGIDGGAATAAAIVKGGQDAIGAVNSLTQQIADQATGLGTEGARWFYQAGVDVAQSLVDGLSQQQAALDAQANQIANQLITQIQKVLGVSIDKNGNIVGGAMYAAGQGVGQSLASGMDSTATLVQQAAARLAAAASGKTTAVSPGGPIGRGLVGGATVQVTVTNPVPETASTSTTRIMRTLALHS